MNFSTLPENLKQSGLFCCWRLEERSGRRTKVPYNPMTGQRTKSNDPGSFTTFDVATMEAGSGK